MASDSSEAPNVPFKYLASKKGWMTNNLFGDYVKSSHDKLLLDPVSPLFKMTNSFLLSRSFMATWDIPLWYDVMMPSSVVLGEERQIQLQWIINLCLNSFTLIERNSDFLAFKQLNEQFSRTHVFEYLMTLSVSKSVNLAPFFHMQFKTIILKYIFLAGNVGGRKLLSAILVKYGLLHWLTSACPEDKMWKLFVFIVEKCSFSVDGSRFLIEELTSIFQKIHKKSENFQEVSKVAKILMEFGGQRVGEIVSLVLTTHEENDCD